MAPPLLLIAVLPENVLFSTEVSSVPLPERGGGAALVKPAVLVSSLEFIKRTVPVLPLL